MMGDGTYKILGSVFVFKNEAQIIFLKLFSFFFLFFSPSKNQHVNTHNDTSNISNKIKKIFVLELDTQIELV